jgi:hypothetical protein
MKTVKTDALILKEVDIHEDDIPAKEETEIKGPWFQSKNENCRR